MDNYEYGNGYDAWLTPIKFDDDGVMHLQGYGPGPPDTKSSDSGIGIPLPTPDPVDPVQEIPYEPLVPQVAPPTSMFSFVVYGEHTALFVNESLGNVESVLWDFGDGETSTEYDPIHQYAGAGTYDVMLTVVNEGGEDYYHKTVITEDPAPEVDFNFAIGGYSVYLTNLSNTAEYFWDFGDGTTSTARNPKHLYAGTGDYVITLKSSGVTVQKTIKIDVEILLTWVDVSSDEDGFKIEWSPDGSTGWIEIADIENPDVESYGVTKAKNGIDSAEMNFFRVLAYNGSGDSGYSNVSNVRCS